MDLSLSWEQQQLKETLDRLVAEKTAGDWRALWRKLAELGVLALPLSEAAGGAGGTAVDAMVVMEALGRGGAVSPYLAAAVLAGGLLDAAGSPAQREALGPALASGEGLVVLAHGERAARYDLAHVATGATRRGGDWVLNGRKDVVPWADAAGRLIVSARVAGPAADRDGIALFLVDPRAAGASLRPYPTVDGHRAADLMLEGVVVSESDAMGEPGRALPAIERAVDRAVAAASAEALGAMAALYEMTLAYAKTRRQFGQTIGQFQVVQHRLVDMFVAVEMARSMAALAALAADRADPAERARDVSAAKAQIARAARFVAQQAVQLHGAVGMTDEYPVGRYFKRLTVLETLFGDADFHRRRFAAS
ncbi:MAG: acyl-CoA dehydrogenase family protein [Alphaproteobacteria bacterium]|nr:acyl-CoA dehydrogenase family protein [Alphaproteobacteria bacterium]